MKTTTNIIYKRFNEIEMQIDQTTIRANWQRTYDSRLAAGLSVYELWKYIKEPSDTLKAEIRRQIMRQAAITLIREQPYFQRKIQIIDSSYCECCDENTEGTYADIDDVNTFCDDEFSVKN